MSSRKPKPFSIKIKARLHRRFSLRSFSFWCVRLNGLTYEKTLDDFTHHMLGERSTMMSWRHGLSQPASRLLDGFYKILEAHFWARLFIVSTAFGVLINFMMASSNLSLVRQCSWRPQLAKQSLYKIFPLPFNVPYFLDNRYRQCQCVVQTLLKMGIRPLNVLDHLCKAI